MSHTTLHTAPYKAVPISFLTNDGEALTGKLLESFQSLLDQPNIIRSICSPPTFNRQ